VGPVAGWPQSLKTIVRTMLDSRYAMWLGWGLDFTFFYDAYATMTLGPKHPWALGRSAREVWSEIWGDIGPRAESILRTGQATWDEGFSCSLNDGDSPKKPTTPSRTARSLTTRAASAARRCGSKAGPGPSPQSRFDRRSAWPGCTHAETSPETV
jgi:hypothetical protein